MNNHRPGDGDCEEEAECRFRLLFEIASDAILIHDLNGNLLEVNQTACKKLGYKKDELLKMRAHDINAPEYAAHISCRVQDLLQKGHIFFETEYITKDGTRIPIELSSQVIDYDGDLAVLSIARDISKRKKAEEALLIKDYAMSTSISAIAISDLEGNLTYVNRAFLKIWDYYHETDVLGRNAAEFWDTQDKAAEVIETVHRTGGWVGELSARRKDGSIFDVELSSSMVYDPSGKPILMMGSFLDITARKEAEKALRESKEKYSAMVKKGNDGIVIIQDGVFAFLNSKMCEITGHTLEEAVGCPFIDFVSPEHRGLVADRYKKRMAGEEVPPIYEINIINTDFHGVFNSHN